MDVIHSTQTIHYNEITESWNAAVDCGVILREDHVLEDVAAIGGVFEQFKKDAKVYERGRLIITFEGEPNRVILATFHSKHQDAGAEDRGIERSAVVLRGEELIEDRKPTEYSTFMMKTATKVFVIAGSMYCGAGTQNEKMAQFSAFQTMVKPLFHMK